MVTIDAHQHYWLVSRGDYGWLQPSSGVLYADYMPQQLRPELEKHRVARTIVVQAAPTVEETEFMLALAEREPTIAGVVGWLDFAGDDFERHYERLRRHPLFVGVRPMIQDLPDDWMLQPIVVERFRLLADAGFPIDLQLRLRLLPAMLKLLEQIPHVKGVVDHLAKPLIHRGERGRWDEHMRELSGYPNLMCKLSGVFPEQEGQPWREEQIFPYLFHAMDLFGERRVMYGSDWPVCLQAGSYEAAYRIVEEAAAERWGRQSEAYTAVMGGNAQRFYLNVI